jgi:site-specific DNA recombinase
VAGFVAILAAVADHVAEIMTSGTHNQTKSLVEALVATVTITGPDRLRPVFRIPQPRNNDGAARPTSGNDPERSGSHND